MPNRRLDEPTASIARVRYPDDLSLKPFWGPRYWLTWALLGFMHARREAAALVASSRR